MLKDRIMTLTDRSGKKSNFVPLDPKHIKMYVCGPTVYSRPHIGNLRSVVVFDILYRILNMMYEKVTYVRNITDIDDKIINASIAQNITSKELATSVYQEFYNDVKFLGCLEPTIEPRATECIDEMISMISILLKSEHAYEAEGNIMFSQTSYKEYGQLSNRVISDMNPGARINVEKYKRNEYDFVLWKSCDRSEIGWDSPFGYGRPGWHIECSAMIHKHLGENFDIHGGGFDLQFPHHENEIAQSCSCFPNSKFAKYWIHNGFVNIKEEKMSKSLGNMIGLGELSSYHANAIRWSLLSSHYRKPISLTDELFDNAQIITSKIKAVLDNAEKEPTIVNMPDIGIDALMDDMNIARYNAALISVFKDARETKGEERQKIINTLYTMWHMIGMQ